MQPHHLDANDVLHMAIYVTLCEGFLGIEPCINVWYRLFFLKRQMVKVADTWVKVMTPCGTALVHHRSAFLALPLEDSVKNWQKGFFYVKNVKEGEDYIN